LKEPMKQPATLPALLAIPDTGLSAEAKLMLIVLVHRSKGRAGNSEERIDVDSLSFDCGLSVDAGRIAARQLHRVDLADMDGRSIRLIQGHTVNRILDGETLAKRPEDVSIKEVRGLLYSDPEPAANLNPAADLPSPVEAAKAAKRKAKPTTC